MSRALSRSWPLLAGAALLAVVALASLGGTGVHLGSRGLDTRALLGGPGPCPDPPAGPATPAQPVAPAAPAQPTPPACVPPDRRLVVGSGADYKIVQVLFSGVGILGGLVLVALVVALFVGLASAAGTIRVRHRPRRAAPAVPDDAGGDAGRDAAGRLGAAAEAGLADLEDGADPRRAVIAAWRRLELAAAAAGTARAPAETPAELATRVLSAHAVSPPTLSHLADLYREARYSAHDVDAAMRADARRAFERLRRELTAGSGRLNS